MTAYALQFDMQKIAIMENTHSVRIEKEYFSTGLLYDDLYLKEKNNNFVGMMVCLRIRQKMHVVSLSDERHSLGSFWNFLSNEEEENSLCQEDGDRHSTLLTSS